MSLDESMDGMFQITYLDDRENKMRNIVKSLANNPVSDNLDCGETHTHTHFEMTSSLNG